MARDVVTLDLDNRYFRLSGASYETIQELEKVTSYRVAGAHFAPAYRRGAWDGREHLLRYSRDFGYRCPLGLLERVLDTLTGLGLPYEFKNHRRRQMLPADRVSYKWDPGLKLRPYQLDAVEKILTDSPPGCRGRGIIKMPIRSGKTKTVARVIKELGVRALCVVPSQMLLHQTVQAFHETLLCDVGILGDSEWRERDLTVATIQTLASARKSGGPRYDKLLSHFGLVVFDECHHLRGNSWRKVMMDFDAPYKIGLSATAYLDNERENEQGVIWLAACCGGVRVDVDTSKLINEGYLLQPNVDLYRITEPDLAGYRWGLKLRNLAVYENEFRNKTIVELARRHTREGLAVLIVTNRLNQVAALSRLLTQARVSHDTITGKDKALVRKQRVKHFVDRTVSVLVGTVLSEGVDIPQIECVINAEGGRDVKATVQRMRNLTPSEGKTRAVFVDFLDLTNHYFAEHSRERLKVYRSESAFAVRLREV